MTESSAVLSDITLISSVSTPSVSEYMTQFTILLGSHQTYVEKKMHFLNKCQLSYCEQFISACFSNEKSYDLITFNQQSLYCYFS